MLKLGKGAYVKLPLGIETEQARKKKVWISFVLNPPPSYSPERDESQKMHNRFTISQNPMQRGHFVKLAGLASFMRTQPTNETASIVPCAIVYSPASCGYCGTLSTTHE